MALPNLLDTYKIQSPKPATTSGLPNLLETKYTPKATAVASITAKADASRAASNDANSLLGLLKATFNPVNLFQASGIPQQFAAGQAQIDQPFIDKGNGAKGQVSALEGALSVGSGLVTKVTAPFAPVLAPIGKLIEEAGKQLANTPYLQNYGKDVANLPVNQTNTPERILTAIQNFSNVAGVVAGGVEGLRGKAPIETPTKLNVTHAEPTGSLPLKPMNQEPLPTIQMGPKAPKPKDTLPVIQAGETPPAQKAGTSAPFNGGTVRQKVDTVLRLSGNSLDDVSIVGSTARGKANPNDLDILVTPKKLADLTPDNLRTRTEMNRLLESELRDQFPGKKIQVTTAKYEPSYGPRISLEDYAAKSSPSLPKEPTFTEKTVTPNKTGEVTKAASDINQTLVKQGFDALPAEEQSKYTPQSYKEQANSIASMMDSNLEEVKAIASGEKPVPRNLNGQILFNAVEALATKEGDGALLTKLAKSPLGKKLSEAGQSLGGHGFNDNAHSAVSAIREVQAARAAKGASRESASSVVSRIKSTINKGHTKETWGSFIKTLEC